MNHLPTNGQHLVKGFTVSRKPNGRPQINFLGLQLCSKKNTVELTGLTWLKTGPMQYYFATWVWTSHQCTLRSRLFINKINAFDANVLWKYIFVFRTLEIHLKNHWKALALPLFTVHSFIIQSIIYSFLQQIFIEPLQTAECCARLWRCYTNKTESFSLKRAGLVGEAKQEDR